LVSGYLGRYPTGFAQWLTALDFALAPVREIAIVGDVDAAETDALLAVVRTGYRAHQVVAAGPVGAVRIGAGSIGVPPDVPLLADRSLVDGRATAYVCRGFACDLPVTDPAALSAKLAAG